MTPALAISGLQVLVSSGKQTGRILDDVNLSLPPGEVTGLIGESGSGKTTLAHAILGILPPSARISSGTIALSARRDGGQAGLGYVPQDPSAALDPLFTVGRQVDDILKARRPDLRNSAARRRAATQVLSAVHLPDPERLLRRRSHELSGGQRQRIVIALAVLVRPVLLVADEPTTALDLTTQAEVLRLLRDLVDRNRLAMLMTTHDPGVAHEVCDNLAVMYGGSLVEQGDASTVLRQPAHPYTRRLLAARSRLRGEGTTLPGGAPSPFARPPGCAFHPRCPERLARCETEAPPWVRDGVHSVRCWKALAA